MRCGTWIRGGADCQEGADTCAVWGRQLLAQWLHGRHPPSSQLYLCCHCLPAEAPRPHVLVTLLGSVYVRQVQEQQQQQQEEEQQQQQVAANGKPRQGGVS